MYDSSSFISKKIFDASLFIAVFLFFICVFSACANAQKNDSVAKGQETFKNKACVACHTIGKGKLSGPDLLGVTERRDEEWLKKWLKSPDKMIMTDPIAKEMLKEFMVPMPNQNLTDEEVINLIEYLKSEDKKNKK